MKCEAYGFAVGSQGDRRPPWHHPAMADPPRGRVVYSSERGRTCARCGWPESDCRCASRAPAADEPVPARIVVKLRMEKAGRGGKTVTVVDGLPRNAAFVAELARDLKRSCGTGGTVLDGAIELQGELRDRVRELLAKRGYVVKG
jgi:translation initiation factor 1